jgi:hypothetical protein
MSVASVAQLLQNQGGGGGGGGVDDIVDGLGITVVDDGSGTFTIENDGIVTATPGVGITLAFDNATGNLTITNSGAGAGGVTSIQDGDGISTDATVGDITITNTGILSATSGSGITVSTVDGVLDIANSGILNITDGDGIAVTITDGVANIENTGVLALTAGTNISISGANDNITINSTGGVAYIATNGNFTFGPQTVGAGQQVDFPFIINGFVSTPQTVAVVNSNSTNSTYTILLTIYPDGAGGFTLSVGNFSGADLTDLTFPFSVIAVNN